MNKRIRELAKQAGFYVSYDDKIHIPTTSEEITDCQTKFAELIVKECVLEAMDAVHHNNSIRLQLYKHFGVE